MSSPVFSPDGKMMWTGDEWIPAPPEENGEENQLTRGIEKAKELVSSITNQQPSDKAREQVSILVNNLAKSVKLHKKWKQMRRADMPFWIMGYILFAAFSVTIWPTWLYALIAIVLVWWLVLGRPKKKKSLKLKGKERIRIWHLTSNIKSIDPLIANFDHHDSLAEYIQLKGVVQSNFMATILIGAAGTAVGVTALSVVASQVKRK